MVFVRRTNPAFDIIRWPRRYTSRSIATDLAATRTLKTVILDIGGFLRRTIYGRPSSRVRCPTFGCYVSSLLWETIRPSPGYRWERMDHRGIIVIRIGVQIAPLWHVLNSDVDRTLPEEQSRVPRPVSRRGRNDKDYGGISLQNIICFRKMKLIILLIGHSGVMATRTDKQTKPQVKLRFVIVFFGTHVGRGNATLN